MSLRLSEKYGVNPAVPICFLCGDDKNQVILAGLIRDKKTGEELEAPHKAAWDMEPCDKCKELQSKGVILISVRDGDDDSKDNPYRTGGWCVVADEGLKRVLPPGPLLDDVLRRRTAFVPDEVWDTIGLPRVEKQDEPSDAGH